jgi:isopropylmalate/homocitrate/citramalate synthase
MRPVPVKKQPVRQSNPAMMLDEAEMALQLAAIAKTHNLTERRRAPEKAAKISPDFLIEMYSAASMIMDRAECDSLAREVQAMIASQPRRAVAA